MQARYETAKRAASLPPPDALMHRIDLNPNDLDARLDLAELHVAHRRFEPALVQLLEIVRRDRTYRADVGRVKMLEVFEMAAMQQELVDTYRAKLSATLF